MGDANCSMCGRGTNDDNCLCPDCQDVSDELRKNEEASFRAEIKGLNMHISMLEERLRQIDSDQYLPSVLWDRDAIDMVWAVKLLARAALKREMPTCCRSDEPMTQAVLDLVKAK